MDVVREAENTDENKTVSVAKVEHADDWMNQPPTLRQMWSQPDVAQFHVRSKEYLVNKRKEPSQDSLLELVWVDLFSGEGDRLKNLCQHRKSYVQKLIKRSEARNERLPFVLAVTLIVPGTPVVASVHYFVQKQREERNLEAESLWERFVAGNDDFRKRRLKLIPAVPDGPWIVRKVCGSKPFIVANCLQTDYYQTDKYLEVAVDINSDRVARHAASLCRSYSTALVARIAFVIEGHEEDELPEAVLGSVQFNRIDLRLATPLQD